jgi:NAD+ synthase (glutamine-hydrolysing)
VKQGFVKVAAVTPKIQVADTAYNTQVILKHIAEAAGEGAKVIVLPELCITGYTCGDLFLQDKLLREAKEALLEIVTFTEKLDAIVFVGFPFAYRGGLYNVAAAVSRGAVLGLVPKTFLPNYNEFYEARHFTRGMEAPVTVTLFTGEEAARITGKNQEITVSMGTNLIFSCKEMPELTIAAEICEDLWTPQPPSIRHALNGANLIVNLSASDETTGKDIYRRDLVGGQSARLVCGYIYASAGDGESTQDVVYSGHNIIAENGRLLAESARFANETVYSEIDVSRLQAERRRMTTYEARWDAYEKISFSLKIEETKLTRTIDPMPFVPGNLTEREKRCDEILSIQAMGLKKRLAHTHCETAVVGISGGLDSTLALLVTVRAFDLLGIKHDRITAVTMPGFGTTDRTYDNAVKLIGCLGADFREVDIKDAVNIHFRDIGQDASVHDVTYENGQARERTQILMDIANKENGMVIGTGDLSELALGWATYNGDHMSMYAVNASVPKTLVRHLVRFYADTCGDEKLSAVLLDILDTPVSPELLPPEDGKISQKTEDLVGPYELHDFFLYHMLRQGFAPAKVYRLAKLAFLGAYDEEIILKWLKTFYRRFFAQQFKRSCLPDGPKVGSVAVSPRGDLRMPSDACAHIWLEELKEL